MGFRYNVNCLLDIFTWVSCLHLQFNSHKVKLIAFTPKYVSLTQFSTSVNVFINRRMESSINGSILDPFVFLFLHNKSFSQICGFCLLMSPPLYSVLVTTISFLNQPMHLNGSSCPLSVLFLIHASHCSQMGISTSRSDPGDNSISRPDQNIT